MTPAGKAVAEALDARGCRHENFEAKVNVARLAREDDGRITGYMAEITVKCADCGKDFQFLGLEPGCDTQGARVSLDGLEANIAITPQGMMPSPLHRLAYGVRAAT